MGHLQVAAELGLALVIGFVLLVAVVFIIQVPGSSWATLIQDLLSKQLSSFSFSPHPPQLRVLPWRKHSASMARIPGPKTHFLLGNNLLEMAGAEEVGGVPCPVKPPQLHESMCVFDMSHPHIPGHFRQGLGVEGQVWPRFSSVVHQVPLTIAILFHMCPSLCVCARARAPVSVLASNDHSRTLSPLAQHQQCSSTPLIW